MVIRKAEEKDIAQLIVLLQQVLEIHANIRPDIFISGTTKYNHEDIKEKLGKEESPIYVAVDEKDEVLGYAFCVLKQQPFSSNMVQFKSLYIDDLCVSDNCRGMHIGEALFNYVKQEAKRMDCYEVTLAVWEGNDSAYGFYQHIGLKPKETVMEYILDQD